MLNEDYWDMEFFVVDINGEILLNDKNDAVTITFRKLFEENDFEQGILS